MESLLRTVHSLTCRSVFHWRLVQWQSRCLYHGLNKAGRVRPPWSVCSRLEGSVFNARPCPCTTVSLVRCYAKGAAGRKAENEPTEQREIPPLNMDVCVGANIYKTGEDPPIGEESEYPDWLWELLEPKKSYKELSPDTKQYWRRYNKEMARHRNKVMEQLGS